MIFKNRASWGSLKPLYLYNSIYFFLICCTQILCIHLKRFRHEVMYSFKISSHVSFPLEGLDLQPFLAKDSPSQITTYDLLSVICHHGTAGSESTIANWHLHTSISVWKPLISNAVNMLILKYLRCAYEFVGWLSDNNWVVLIEPKNKRTSALFLTQFFSHSQSSVSY